MRRRGVDRRATAAALGARELQTAAGRLSIEATAQRLVLGKLGCARNDVFLCQQDDDLQAVPPFHIAFSEEKMDGSLLAVADEEGCLSFYNTRDARPRLPPQHQPHDHAPPIARIAAHENAIFDMIWCNQDAYIATASGDQQIGIWDVETGAHVYHLSGHSMSVKCIRQHPMHPSVFASGSRDGNVFLWDARLPPPPLVAGPPVPRLLRPFTGCARCHDYEVPTDRRKKRRVSVPNTQRSVTCIEFTGDGTQMISAGAVDGHVKFWDVRHLFPPATPPKLPQHVRSLACHAPSGRRYGISSLSLDHTKSRLLVSAASNEILLYDLLAATDVPVAKFHGHRNSSFYVKSAFSPESRFIVSGSVDQRVYIWDVAQAGLPVRVLHGHEGEVSSVAWSRRDFTKLASCSDDGTVRVWTMRRGGDSKDDAAVCGRGCAMGYSTPYEPPAVVADEAPPEVQAPMPPPTPEATTAPSPTPAARPVRQMLTLHHFWR
ncbi:hypothetical protein ACHHYP_04259 [Achlya hypogyna]|uniref:Uncharacterized protein n=1 Tax=Achlya hypogyna TaxID=1202772 RepID=A0A1V9Z1T3_ACHHY|nr:hypothetical protein ACHHYP_04259 [Achlya hypogyna]